MQKKRVQKLYYAIVNLSNRKKQLKIKTNTHKMTRTLVTKPQKPTKAAYMSLKRDHNSFCLINFNKDT